MYPSILYTLKRLKFRYLLKIANIGKKKIYKKFANPKNRRTFAFGNGNKTETKKLFDNIDSDIALVKCCYICLFAVCHYAT